MPAPLTTGVIALSAATTAGKKLIESVTADIYSGLKTSGKAWFSAYKSKSKISELYKRISTLRNVKTIWQVDREVDLNEFYYPAQVHRDGERHEVTNLDSIAPSGNVVIRGTVGMGKSMLLRWLGSRELQTGRLLPLFIELRGRTSSKTLKELLLDRLQAWGFERDEEVLSALMKNGNAVLLCDAFDEVDESLQSETIHDLEQLAQQHQSLRIIVTSRPDTSIINSAFFRVVPLAELKPDDVPRIIQKLTEPELSNRLIQELETAPKHITSLLKTPLLTTLLVISYRTEQRIPETISAFYERLFDVLLIRHDNTKPGYRRTRTSKLGDSDMRGLFECFCFNSRNEGNSEFTKSKGIKWAKQAIKYCDCKCSADDFLNDISRITCLILEEGGRLHFVHKSVQEYFCAAFVNQLRQEKRAEFYKSCLNDFSGFWQSELDFLSQLDRHVFIDNLEIPRLTRLILLLLKSDKIPSTPSETEISAGWKRFLDSIYYESAESQGHEKPHIMNGMIHINIEHAKLDENCIVADQLIQVGDIIEPLAKHTLNNDMYGWRISDNARGNKLTQHQISDLENVKSKARTQYKKLLLASCQKIVQLNAESKRLKNRQGKIRFSI